MTGTGSRRDAATGLHTGVRSILTGLILASLAAAAPLDDAAAKKRSGGAQSLKEDIAGPLTITISLRRQRLQVFDADGHIASAPISSGRRGHRTPKGVFTILQKRRRHYSNLYGGAPMPNMQRLTWSGIAMHAGRLPGYPDSHGCIRLPGKFSRYLFGLTSLGGRVIVTDDPVSPQPIAHEALLKPLPPGDLEATVQTASLVSRIDADTAARTAGMLLGVSPANAAEAPLTRMPVRTRASVAQARARELLDLEADLARSRTTEQGIGAELKSANLRLRDTIVAVKKAEAELSRVTDLIAETERALAATSDLMRDFMKSHAATQGEGALAKAAAEEDALEARLLDDIATLELAQTDRESLLALVEERRRSASRSKEDRDVLLRRHIASRKAAVAASAALDRAKEAADRSDMPITVLLSKKAGMMYVRQGYDDMFETPVEFTVPEAPVGTHVFTALAYTEDGTDLTWHVVTATTRDQAPRRKSGKSIKMKAEQTDTAEIPKQTPSNALDRVKIPQAVRDQLAEHIKPGSSIIITDEGKSYETGEYTDLIVEYR